MIYDVYDYMTILLSREISDGDTVFFGVSSHMPAIAALLAKRLHAPNCTILNIPGGTNPKIKGLNALTSASSDMVIGADGYFPLAEVFDLSMRGRLSTAFLSGIQFDYFGNVNASVIGGCKTPKFRAPGGAGSAVLIPTAKKAVIWRDKHDMRTFVKNVDFVTTRGNIGAIVTPLCIFGFNGENLYIKSIHEGVDGDFVKENTGFLVDTNAPPTISPTEKELRTLKLMDTNNLRKCGTTAKSIK